MENELRHHHTVIVIMFLLIIGSATVFLWYMKSVKPDLQPLVAVPTSPTSSTSASPLDVPSSTASAPSAETNPIDEGYTNPFE